VVAVGEVPERSITGLVTSLRRRGVRVRLYTGAARVLTERSTVEEFGGVGLIAMEESMPCPARSASKRAMDLAIALPGLLVYALYALVSGLFRRSGPLTVKRELVGRGGHPFVASFLAGAENAPRRGAVAALPLLYNVVRGQLSFVGPKPLTPDAWREAGGSWKGIRSNLVPGLVGVWSVDGAGGDDPERLEAMDMQYLRDWSLSLDLKIIVKALAGKGTPPHVGTKR
jgi:lipopolysaccharide/colanic/teichoic acid biosynthesis glycosyltransferase